MTFEVNVKRSTLSGNSTAMATTTMMKYWYRVQMRLCAVQFVSVTLAALGTTY